MHQILRSAAFAVVLAGAVVTAGCAGTGLAVGYRVYDPYRADYHVWDGNEGAFYGQWTAETHRDPHRDLRKLNHGDQEEYWKWRHNQPDRR